MRCSPGGLVPAARQRRIDETVLPTSFSEIRYTCAVHGTIASGTASDSHLPYRICSASAKTVPTRRWKSYTKFIPTERPHS